MYTVSQKKLCHFDFYCNFGKCWSIFKILSLSDKNPIDVVDFVSNLTTSM